MNRRSLLIGIGSALAAPAIVRAESLMKIIVTRPQAIKWIDWELEITETIGHEFVFQTSLPTSAWRAYNLGVLYERSSHTIKAPLGGFEIGRS